MSRQPRNMAHPALCAQLIAYSALRRASSSLPPGAALAGSGLHHAKAGGGAAPGQRSEMSSQIRVEVSPSHGR